MIVIVNLLATIVNVVLAIIEQIKSIKKTNKVEKSQGSPEQSSIRRLKVDIGQGVKVEKKQKIRKFRMNYNFNIKIDEAAKQMGGFGGIKKLGSPTRKMR